MTDETKNESNGKVASLDSRIGFARFVKGLAPEVFESVGQVINILAGALPDVKEMKEDYHRSIGGDYK